MTVALREPIKVIGDILLSELELPPSQIMLAYQRYSIPNNPGLYIALSYLDTQLIGVVSGSAPDDIVGMIETQSATLRHSIQIDAMSFDDSARTRRAEIVMALGSVFAKQQMERNNLQIARLPTSFSDISSLEEAAFLNRYAIVVACTALSIKTKVPPYFDSFDGKYVTNQEITETPFSPEEDPFHV